MHQGTKLKYYVDRSSVSNEEIARLSGISPASLYNYFKEEEIDSKKLKKVLKVLDIDYNGFVQGTASESSHSYSLAERVKELEDQITFLKKALEDKQQIIDLLKNKKK